MGVTTTWAAQPPKEACYVLQAQDSSVLTLQIPSAICIERLEVDFSQKIVLASSYRTPDAVVSLDLNEITKGNDGTYGFKSTSQLLLATIYDCEKTESVKLQIHGKTNEVGETNPTLLEISVLHKVQDRKCQIRDLSRTYKYVLSKDTL